MRLLHVTDFHFRPDWFSWLEREATKFDAVAYTGDFLNLFDRSIPFAKQAATIKEFIITFPRPLFICTGNHDFEPGSSKLPAFLSYAAKENDGLHVDGTDMIFRGHRFVCCGWQRVPPVLDNLREPVVLLSHAPPAETKVGAGEMGEQGDYGVYALAETLPEGSVVLSGHQHAPRAWHCKVGHTLCLNPGAPARRYPNRIELTLSDKRTAVLCEGERVGHQFPVRF